MEERKSPSHSLEGRKCPARGAQEALGGGEGAGKVDPEKGVKSSWRRRDAELSRSSPVSSEDAATRSDFLNLPPPCLAAWASGRRYSTSGFAQHWGSAWLVHRGCCKG